MEEKIQCDRNEMEKYDDITYNELLEELSAAREETRSNESLIIQIISLAGVFLGIIYGVFFDTALKMENIKYVLFVLSITIVSAACSYLITLGVRNVLLYYHIKDIEQKLKNYNIQNGMDITVRWSSLISPIVTRNPFHLKTMYAILYYLGYTIAVCSAFLFGVIIIISEYDNISKGMNYRLKILICIFLIFMLLIILSFFFCTFRTESMYKQLRDRVVGSKKMKQSTNKDIRDIAKAILYYIYPKTEDCQKLILFFIGALIGICIHSKRNLINIWGNIPWKSVFLYLCVMDICLYQSRYHWNDIRGIGKDKEENKTRRLPCNVFGVIGATIIAAVVIGIKVISAFVLAYMYGAKEYLFITLICAGILFAITVCYEYFKETQNKYGVLFSVCLGYPYRILVGIWWMNPKLFFIFSKSPTSVEIGIIILLIAYLFYGAYVVYIPWLMNSIKFRNKLQQLSKPHYQYLYDQIKDRLTEKNKNTPLRLKGKITDSWNWTYITAIFLLSIGTIYTTIENRQIIILLELLLIVISICLVCATDKMIIIFTGITMIDIIGSLIIILKTGIGTVFPITFIIHQLFFLMTYFAVRYLWDEGFNMGEYLREKALVLVRILVGKDTFNRILQEYLKRRE